MTHLPPRPVIAVAAAALLALAAAACSGSAPTAHHAAGAISAQVRVNQVGYPEASPKVAFAMLTRKASAVSFTVTGPGGAAFSGRSTDDLGAWNAHYPAVFELSFTGVGKPGEYHITASANGTTATSPAFTIGTPAALYHKLVLNAVRYYTSERDGPDVVHSVMNRQPANLTDSHAYVYATPAFTTDGNDNVVGTFHKIGGPVNVAGGWFDAGGGYEKFAYTSAYADALMMIAQRDAPGVYPTLGPEAAFGLNWLKELWNPTKKVMYVQVGIGDGNASIQGDYNYWFLPQMEDQMNVTANGRKPFGPHAYYVKYRPVIEAAPPGKPIDPDLAGRFAADFALGAQLDAATNHAAAAQLLSLARGVYAMAKTTHVGSIITAYPHDFYPGTEWKSDMAWGAAEIALADQALHAPSPQLAADMKTAGTWAKAYLAQGHPKNGDTFNLYDNGAVAEAELMRAMAQTTASPGVPKATLLNDMAAQLKLGEAWAKTNLFSLGTGLGPNDASPHAFGLYITDALYQEYGGSSAYESFAQQQLNFALGANAWGTSFVVGAGTTFPHCMQSEIANITGSRTGKGDIQLGATTDGPSSTTNFQGLGTVTGMRTCSAGAYAPYDTKVASYEDNVVAWPSVEPALDYAAAPLLAFTLGAQGLG